MTLNSCAKELRVSSGFNRTCATAERQDEETGAPVLARLRMARHGVVAVIDLGFFTVRRGNDHARLQRRRVSEDGHEAAHAQIPGGEALVVDEVLPDGHGVAASPERLNDQLRTQLNFEDTQRIAQLAAKLMF